MPKFATKPTVVDGVLKEWGDRLYYEKPHAKRWTVFETVKPGRAGRQVTPKIVRRKLLLTVKRTPEVMVKITAGGKNIQQVKNHIAYISRNGKVSLEDESGHIYQGTKTAMEVKRDWDRVGYQIPREGARRREAFNIVLSMPPGTNAEAVKSAARAFATKTFPKSQYVMALHDGTEDDHKKAMRGGKNVNTKAPHPHVHLCVKAVDMEGVRLNPRKADLQRWRECFADQLIERGVLANATPRSYRKQRVLPYKIQQKERDLRQGRAGRPQVEQSDIELKTNTILRGYVEMSDVLHKSPDKNDRNLSKGVDNFIGREHLKNSRLKRDKDFEQEH
jgi:hypothetical protein